MRMIKLITLLGLLSLGLFGQSRISGSCKNSGDYPNCDSGEIVFTGSNFADTVHITVTNSSGKVIDDSDYTTSGGVLTFYENLSFADTYTVSIDNQAVLTVTTS